MMKKTKIIYWITTGLLALMMAFSAFAYLTSPDMAKQFEHLGYPGYFRIELAIAKFIGVALLLIPNINSRLKEWAYAGFTFVFISAIIGHLYIGDGIGVAMAPTIALILLVISYVTYHRLAPKKYN